MTKNKRHNRYPLRIEQDYSRALVRIVREDRKRLKKLSGNLGKLLKQNTKENKNDANTLTFIFSFFEKSKRTKKQIAAAKKLAENKAKGIQNHADREFDKLIKNKGPKRINTVGIFAKTKELRKLERVFVSDNVDLIKDVSDKFYREAKRTVTNGINKGRLVRDIKEDLKTLGIKTENRAKLIARDQTGKYYGEVNKHRQVSAGLNEFTWITMGEDRVRESHKELHGQVFSWEDLPLGGLQPGEDYQCRCYADPIF